MSPGKRMLDVAVAGTSMVVFFIPFSLLCLLVKFTSPGSVFYRSWRVGRDAKPFAILKFRTMVVDADKQGPGVTAGDDPRITPIGRFLRSTKLDELPQLLNVLRGDMSLVGPRPEAPQYVAHYTPEQREVLKATPGLTGPTQLRWRHEQELLRGVPNVDEYYLREIMPAKLNSDLEYVRSNPSVWRDLRYLMQTVRVIFH